MFTPAPKCLAHAATVQHAKPRQKADVLFELREAKPSSESFLQFVLFPGRTNRAMTHTDESLGPIHLLCCRFSASSSTCKSGYLSPFRQRPRVQLLVQHNLPSPTCRDPFRHATRVVPLALLPSWEHHRTACAGRKHALMLRPEFYGSNAPKLAYEAEPKNTVPLVEVTT